LVEHVASQDPYDRNNLAFMNSLAALPNGPVYNPLAPLGTFENPFLTVQQAKDHFFDPPTDKMPGDIVYVWSNSKFVGDVVNDKTLESNVRWLGDADGVTHQIQIDPFGLVNMPRAIDNPNSLVNPDLRPEYTGIVGDGIILANNAEFSGF